MEYSTTEDKIKEQMGINNWRELSKNKLLEFLANIEMNPNISKEEYFEVLKNIPQFMDAFKETMYAVKETISQSKKASDETKQYYSALIDGLIKLLSNKDISEKDKENIFSIIKDVNAYINELDKRDREFFDKALKVVGTLGVIVLTIVGTIVGIKMSEKLPKNIT